MTTVGGYEVVEDHGLWFMLDTPHHLRHAHASWLLAAGGADLQVVKERLGHASIATDRAVPSHAPYR